MVHERLGGRHQGARDGHPRTPIRGRAPTRLAGRPAYSTIFIRQPASARCGGMWLLFKRSSSPLEAPQEKLAEASEEVEMLDTVKDTLKVRSSQRKRS